MLLFLFQFIFRQFYNVRIYGFKDINITFNNNVENIFHKYKKSMAHKNKFL